MAVTNQGMFYGNSVGSFWFSTLLCALELSWDYSKTAMATRQPFHASKSTG
jgi:hypothetical protein